MFAHALALFGLLAFSSAGLLEVTPSRLYLPATTTQEQTNTVRTSQPAQFTTIHVPTVVTAFQQHPLVSTVSQVPITRATATETYTVNSNTLQPAQIHTVGIPSVVSFVSQQVPTTRTTGTQQYTFNTRTAQSDQTVNVPTVVSTSQHVPITVSQQVPVSVSQQTRQTTGTQQVTSTVNTNTRTSQPAQFHTVAFPSLVSTTSQQVPSRQIAIVRLANENVGDGTYRYNYETENGISAEEQGQANVAGAETAERVHGSYSYTGPDNVRYTINYVADENGYRAEGAHLPVPPTPIAQAPQVTTGVAQFAQNVDTRSAVSNVHVLPTTAISQPVQLVQAPSAYSQRQATTVQTTYQQHAPALQSQQNILRQTTLVPSATLTVQQGTGYIQQADNSVHTQQGVYGRQSTAVPTSTVTVQHGTSGYSTQQTGSGAFHTQQVSQRQSAVLPSTVTLQQGTGQQTDSASVQAQQVLHRQSTFVPSTVTFHQGATGYATQQAGASGIAQGVLRQTSVVPSSTITVQPGSIGYTTQTGVSSVQFQQGVLQRQASEVPTNTVTVQQQSVQNQQEVVESQNTVVPSTVAVQQGASYNSQQSQFGVVQNTVVPSNTVTVQHGAATQQSGVTQAAQQGLVHSQNTVVPSNAVTVQQNTGSSTQQQVQTQQVTLPQTTSGVSSSHVTVQLGTSGYATQQVGDSSSVQILEGGLHQNTVPTNNLNVQQVNQQTGVTQQTVQPQQVVQSQNVVPTNLVSEQQTTNQQVTNQGASVSQQGVVLPDGTVHYGY